MARVRSRPDDSVVGGRWFLIEGESTQDVQAAINTIINWVGLLSGSNSAEFRNPKRAGNIFIACGYTLIDAKNSYDTLEFE